MMAPLVQVKVAGQEWEKAGEEVGVEQGGMGGTRYIWDLHL